MKIYKTFEEVSGLRPCMKLPIVVHAMEVEESFRVESLEGDYAVGSPGDYLMKGIEGENYICNKDSFEKSYKFIEEK